MSHMERLCDIRRRILNEYGLAFSCLIEAVLGFLGGSAVGEFGDLGEDLAEEGWGA